MTTAGSASAGSMPEITPAELAGVVGTGTWPALLDVREPGEFASWALPGAENVPLGRLAGALDRLPRDRDVVVVCASGSRSARAVEALRAIGVPARNLAGGMLAWASFYDTAALDLPEARIVQVRRRGKGCLSYVVGAGGEAAVVDPSLDLDRYHEVAAAQGWQITRVLDTHLHADHLSGARALAEATGAALHLNPGDGYRYPFEPVADGDELDLGGGAAKLRVLTSPGHTPGSTVLALGAALLTGDTLFVDGVGRPDLADDAEAFARSLHRSLHEKVLVGPPDSTVLPAHVGESIAIAPGTVVGVPLEQLRSSLQQLTWPEDDFVAWASTVARPRPPNYRAIVEVNAGDASLPLDDLRRLELGPNRCAA